jgi:hypothetical protein
MPLEVNGVPIMTLGDFTVLINGLSDDAQPLGTLGAWRNFEPVDPQALHNTLAVTCRTFSKPGPAGDPARRVIDGALTRLNAVPGVVSP